MFSFQDLQAQVERHREIAKHDIRKRWLAALLPSFLMAYADMWGGAVALIVCAVVVESANMYLVRTTPVANLVSARRIAATLFFASMFAVLVSVSTITLSFTGDIGLFLYSFVIAVSTAMLTMFVYSRTPAFFVAHVVPAVATMLVLTANILLTNPLDIGAVLLGVIALAMLLVARLPHQLYMDFKEQSAEWGRLRSLSLMRLQQLEYMSKHDCLTDLMNRAAFEEKLAKTLEALPEHLRLAVVMIDLNGFKPINDSYGHEAGDKVLVAVAALLKELESETCFAARLGGDEFALLVIGSDEKHFARVGQNVIDSACVPIPFEDKELRLTASVGIAVTGKELTSATILSSCADQAMYRAKTEKSTFPVLYDPKKFSPRLTLADRERYLIAVHQMEIQPNYQPKAHLLTGELVGFEALARWYHPDKGLLLPRDFLGDLEELGLLLDFTLGMLRQVLQDIQSWKQAGLPVGQISVNMPETVMATHSGWQEIDCILSEFPDTAPHLVFEITEDVFIARSGDIIASTIERFRRNGIRISLDDFGTGYASFQHLRQLEFDELKIDTSFVSGLGKDPVSGVIVDGFMSIAQGLGVPVVAEGVESAEQIRLLADRGCEYAQGHYFGAAMDRSEAQNLLSADPTNFAQSVGKTQSRRA